MKKPLIIFGPTASGKSNLAIYYAQLLNGHIINADRMQMYYDLSILSANPSFEDYELCSHALYGLIEWNENINVARWIELCNKQVELSFQQEKTPIIVGGSAMYIYSLLNGIVNIPSVEPSLLGVLEAKETHELYKQLFAVDKKSASIIHPNHRSRIIRALSVIKQTGRSIIDFHQQQTASLNDQPTEQYTQVYINQPIIKLHQKIQSRIESMIKNGAVEQVEHFLKSKIETTKQYENLLTFIQNNSKQYTIFKTIGFIEVVEYICNKISQKTMIERIFTKTRQYAKHQNTWFRQKFLPNFTIITR